MNGRYNTRSPAVKRLMREAQELSEPTDQYFAQPLDDNLFEWHFTVRGPADSDFQNGIYHGRIILPVDYPMKPPSIIWLTPNGRFETHKKICLSISGHHPESWQPSWSIRTALLAIIGFMPTHPGGAIGSLDYTPEERKVMAKKSKEWKCPTCGEVTGILLDASANSEATSNEAKELAAQINLQGEKPKCKEGTCPIEQARLSEIQSQSADATPESQTTNTSNDSVGQASDLSPTFNNNTSSSNQHVLNGPQESSPSVPQQMSIPQLPPWCPFPMPPAGFPFHYPGMGYPNMPPMMPMQFPYPPSHYAANPQSCWPMPPPNGMFPGSFPPPPFSSSPISTNNSSIHGNTGDVSINKNSQPSNSQYSRSPMTCPVLTNRASPTVSNNATSYSQGRVESPQSHVDIFKELLTKVKRVGSEAKCEQTTAENSEGQSAGSSETQETAANSEVSFKPDRSEEARIQHKKENILSKHADGGTDSDISKSLKKSGDRSVSEQGDTNTEDNSESDALPIDADQRCGLEKNACSSTSDLERWKQKYQTNKGLRQRQSATASIPTDVTEEAVVEPERSEDGPVRQRIEAASGDTGLRNRPRIGAPRLVNLNLPDMANNVRQTPERTYDLTFYLMLGLFTTSMVILINRLSMIDWSGFL